jgi:hypothetical protein
MSIGSLGIIGGLAGSALPQRATETVRADRESIEQTRALKTAERAELAAGIGQTEEDAGTSERDADGRRLWELDELINKSKDSTDSTAAAASASLSKDPSGTRGLQLDLTG